MEELKKCPFCGGEAEVYFCKRTESWYVECALSKVTCATIPCTYPYSTKEEAIKEIERRKNNRNEEISSQIHSVEDLLNVMFASMYCAEYVDYEKIEVVKCKTKELLGVELKR